MSEGPSLPSVFVGVGASAGGLEACKEFFAAVPADSGIAFAVVLHLDPTRASHVAEILQGATDHLTVIQAEGASRLEPNYAYVIAPNSKLKLTDGHLEVTALTEGEPRGTLIDYLFASLAEVKARHAVGIVLSGAGHDGTEGLKLIRAAGGLTFAQDPATAGSPSMPQSAIDAGVIDAVLAPAAIPQSLLEFAQTGARPEPDQSERALRDENGDSDIRDAFAQVLAQISETADVNFDDYKIGTIERRARRRMEARNITDWSTYAARLADDDEERDALYRDVLIGVTEFFRDPDAWERLGQELPSFLGQCEEPGVRAWVPACATGEEAYSLAMLLQEHLPARTSNKMQIYATDLNDGALAAARRGLYSHEALEHVDPGRRERFFHQHDGQLQIERSLRDSITFAVHNVLSDPPFSKMDIVSCRNLLIYLKPRTHDALLKRLHFALRPGGLLILGRAETLGRSTSLFEEVAKAQGIYRARSLPAGERLQLKPRKTGSIRRSKDDAAAVPTPLRTRRAPESDRRIEQFVLRERTAASVVVNEDLEIRCFYGQTQRYLLPPTGESRQDLLAWIRPGFYVGLRSALRQAVESTEPVSAEGQIDRDGVTQRVRCSVTALPATVGADGLLLVSFYDLGESMRKRKADIAEADEPLVRELEQELSDTRRELQTTIEHLESAGEEHDASNEELQSLNEELQSSNEELEASKEELEALNEEMNTINRELEDKNTELREANADLGNLFLSTGIPTVFLNRDLCIRRFTAAASNVFRLVSSDVGRSIEHIKERFDGGDTVNTCKRVLESLEADSCEVRADNGRCYTRTVLPYRLDADEVAGLCITFSDITEQKEALHASQQAHAYSEAILETVRTPVLVLDGQLRVLSFNRSFRTNFDASTDLVGCRLDEVFNQQWSVPGLDELLRRLLAEGEEVNDFEVIAHERSILVNARRVLSGSEFDRLVLSFEDVTDQRAARQHSDRRAAELREDARRKDEWIAMLGHELRNPIGAIGNAVTVMKSSKSPPERRPELLAMIDRQVKHITGLLNDLLDAARIISGKLDIERELIDLVEVAEWAIDLVRPQIDSQHHELIVDLPVKGEVCVHGDHLRLTEVFSNLLGNAAKYTEPGGTITLAVTADEDSVMLSVRDTGIGIETDDFKERMFEIFTQGPRSLGRSERGLGLGLPLVRRFVELHGGRVDVESGGTDQGSEFRVTLPRAQRAVSRPRAERKSHALTHPLRILIVDDEPDALETLDEMVHSHGHETRTAADGSSALVIAKDFHPEVGLLDIGLPKMSGYELARELRRELPDIVLIAVTGYQRDSGRLAEAGFDHHCLKPVDMTLLARAIGAGVTGFA